MTNDTIDPVSAIMLDLENKARAEMARRDAREHALYDEILDRDAREEALWCALRRSQGWSAVFVWTTLLLAVVLVWRWM